MNIFFVKNGRKYPPTVSDETLDYAVNYMPADDDLFLVSYPKSGSHWIYFIIKLIANNGSNDSDEALGTKRPTKIECQGVYTIRKPVITTELPYELVPKNPLAKYLYVFRNPKDTAVSLYYHLITSGYISEEMDFHQFCRQWISGEDTDYFTDVSDYWRHRFNGKSDYVVYEQMIRNPKEGVLKIANFLGKEFVDKLLANNELLLNEVLKKSCFDYMKSNHIFEEIHLRKGIVGDWRSHLTRDESDLIDAKFTQYFSGTELESIWSEDMKW